MNGVVVGDFERLPGVLGDLANDAGDQDGRAGVRAARVPDVRADRDVGAAGPALRS
jgi:hypothetical protein